MNAVYYDIGQRIRNRRRELKIKTKVLADACGYASQISILEIERGKIRVQIEVLYAIAKALDISIYMLLPDNKEQS